MKEILIVDDDRDLRESLAEALADCDRLDWRVRFAGSGHEALELLAAPPLPELILMDLMMPRMSGLELAALLHGQPETRGVPIWVMSHMDLGDLRARPAVPGVTGFLEKPRDLDTLLRAIERLTGA